MIELGPLFPAEVSIAAARVDRQLSDSSLRNVLDFSAQLTQEDKYFIPEPEYKIGLGIISSREYAKSYRNSPANSKVRILGEHTCAGLIENDMQKSIHFNKNIYSEVEDVNLIENNDRLYLGLTLSSTVIMDERRLAVNSLRHLSHYPLGWDSVPYIIIGKFPPKIARKSALKAQDKAHFLFESEKYQEKLGKLHFNPGSVRLHLMDLLD